MSKEEVWKIQTCTLKVDNIDCDGCKKKVTKILKKIEGVYSVRIGSESGLVTVTGNVDPLILIKKLKKEGKKHSEIWGDPKENQQMNDMFKNMKIDGGKGGGGNDKNEKGKGKQIDGGKGGGGNDKNEKGKGKKPQQIDSDDDDGDAGGDDDDDDDMD